MLTLINLFQKPGKPTARKRKTSEPHRIISALNPPLQKNRTVGTVCTYFLGSTPSPMMPATTRIITFLVTRESRVQPSFATVTGWGTTLGGEPLSRWTTLKLAPATTTTWPGQQQVGSKPLKKQGFNCRNDITAISLKEWCIRITIYLYLSIHIYITCGYLSHEIWSSRIEHLPLTKCPITSRLIKGSDFLFALMPLRDSAQQ